VIPVATSFLIAGAAIGSAGALAATNSLRFRRRVRREARELRAGTAEPRPIQRARLEELPAPVRRYLYLALGTRGQTVRTVRLRHGGTFRPKFDGQWLPIRGEQYFTADPPGFIWWGRVRLGPGLWVDARDRSVRAVGSMLVSAESSFTLADAAGPELDRGALHRLLGEMTWFPTALLDDRYVSWSAIDDRRAQAILRLNGREVAGVFEFTADGLPARFSASRYRDLGGGHAVLTPFSGEYGDYRHAAGLLVPHEVTACWQVDGQRIPYALFEVERLDYDEATAS
jgi:hypothetical protein